MHRLVLPLFVLGVLLSGCGRDHTTSPSVPPAAPRGLFSITGDHQVTLVWLANTEPDVSAYRIYSAPCPQGQDCEADLVAEIPAPPGEEYVEYVVHGLANGVPRFYAVSAVGRGGREGPMSSGNVFDTPRPAGTGQVIDNFLVSHRGVGYDFSAFTSTNVTDPPTDIFYGYYEDSTGFLHQQVFVPDYSTDIQDAGYSKSLDAVDFAPDSGWSPSGTVEAIVGHNYVVWTRDSHFAKFRITTVSPTAMQFDWAYQVDMSNRELKARRALEGQGPRRRPVVWLRR